MKDDTLYLIHVAERCRRIGRFISSGREQFMAAEELQDAVIRNIEVIGEAAKENLLSDSRENARYRLAKGLRYA